MNFFVDFDFVQSKKLSSNPVDYNSVQIKFESLEISNLPIITKNIKLSLRINSDAEKKEEESRIVLFCDLPERIETGLDELKSDLDKVIPMKVMRILLSQKM